MRTANREAPRCDFYSKPARGGTGTSGKSLVCPLFPHLLLPLPSLAASLLGVLTSSPLLRPGAPPVGEVKGKPVGVTQQIWQLTQHQPLACLSSCHRDQRGLPRRDGGEGRESGFPFFSPMAPEEREQLGMEGVCYRNKEDGAKGGEGGGVFFCCALVKIKLRIVCLYISFLDPAPGYLCAHK